MSFYKISFEQLRLRPELADMLQALERGFKKFEIDFYLVGAVSRNVWMSGINNISPRRATRDIDFAVFINDKGIYEAIKEYFISEEDFEAYKGNAFVLLWKDGTQVDLLPFGNIEDENRRVTVEGTGYTSVNVDGFKEIYDEGLPEIEMQDVSPFKVCTLPGIIVLKLIAWDDRPEVRRDDIKDISDIISHFFSMNDNLIWDEHSDLFEGDDADLQLISARVIGRLIKKIADRNDKLQERIQRILANNAGEPAESRMAAIMVEYFNTSVKECTDLVREILKGFEE
ncbi:nucleotidyl transferase AbiEii/AbiGii toxin family protein [Chitinophaga pollutisoli]|uniref:Nucleotidyl transferase AbiEii/AbiGii toxin family protein n=1 Tax=Chitinophaga pollutisoli TaxID=3133966 RepID=A0ABZ2YXG8_9BACT